MCFLLMTNSLNSNSFILEQNYPNPFNPTTNIRFRIADRGFATLTVFNVLGNEIETLVNKELEKGEYKFAFDASGIPSGIYFYQLKVGSFIQTNKMVFLK